MPEEPLSHDQRIGRPSRSGYKGVGSRRSGWVASIYRNGRSIYLGLFDTKEDAAAAYNLAATFLRGESAELNVLPPERQPTPEREQEIRACVGKRLLAAAGFQVEHRPRTPQTKSPEQNHP